MKSILSTDPYDIQEFEKRRTEIFTLLDSLNRDVSNMTIVEIGWI